MNGSRPWVLGVCAALALVAAGCGSSGSSSSSTSASTTTATAAAQGAGAPSAAQIQARVNLAKCARAHGIDLPDPSANGTFGSRNAITLENIVRQYGQTKVNEVLQACRQYLVIAFPNLALTPAQRAQRRQALFQFAACMRSHGVPNFPDPGAGAAAIKPGEINPNSPAFKSALTRCRGLIPPRVAVG
jgi:hypothetical protein